MKNQRTGTLSARNGTGRRGTERMLEKQSDVRIDSQTAGVAGPAAGDCWTKPSREGPRRGPFRPRGKGRNKYILRSLLKMLPFIFILLRGQRTGPRSSLHIALSQRTSHPPTQAIALLASESCFVAFTGETIHPSSQGTRGEFSRHCSTSCLTVL